MVMTFRGYASRNLEPEQKVAIEETGDDEIEVISVFPGIDPDDADARSVLSGRSAKSLFDDLTSDEEEESDEEQLGGMTFMSNTHKAGGYEINRGWTALHQIDSFLASIEDGMSIAASKATQPQQQQPKAVEQTDMMVDDNSTTASSKSNDEPLNETISLSDQSTAAYTSTFQKKINDHSKKEKHLRSKAKKDRKVIDAEVKSRNKRIRLFLLLLLFITTVCVATVFGVKAGNGDDEQSSSTAPIKANQPDGISPQQPDADETDPESPTTEDSTTSLEPPVTPVDTTPNQPDVLVDVPEETNDDDDYTNPIVTVDPSTLSPSATNPLVQTLKSAYQRRGMDSSPLDDSRDDTPQKKALAWLASRDNQLYNAPSIQVTRYALAVFYYSTNAVPNYFLEDPDSWQLVDGWLTAIGHCSWYGIVCNLQGGVESIEMSDNFLSGKLPVELGLLNDSLYSIDIMDNDIFMFGSDYDVFLYLGNLELLYANSNYFETLDGLPTQMASMIYMDELELSYNILGGDLSSNNVLESMPFLTLLELDSNHFTGPIPNYIGKLENLVYLYLRDNYFTGDLSFVNEGGLTNLFAMWLETNQISGELPASFATLTELRSLVLSENQLSGSIEVLGSLPDLRRIWIHTNEFSGDIPKSLEALQQVEILELHNNNFGGKMPKGLCDVFAAETYAGKALTSDCNGNVECKADCCTACY